MTTSNDDTQDRDDSRRTRSHDEGSGEERECRGGRRRGRHRRRHSEGRGERKERVIHTRVSEKLSDDIRRLAEDLRVPASNLVRNVLEEVFTVVETVTDDVGDLFEELMDEAEDVHDRMRSRSDRHHRRRHRKPTAGRRPQRDSEAKVEDELRQDEAAEASDSTRGANPEPRAEEAPKSVPEFPDVIGWQPLVLNHDRVCASCGVELTRGARAFIGLAAQGLTETTLCRACTGG